MAKAPYPSGTECREGFTLIELLVVIAIIALLMAILIPTLNMARKQVRGTVCMAALKQWGLCYHLYAQDHESKLPVFIGGTHQTTYMDSLRPYYADINKMRTCPSATQVATGNPTGAQAQSFFGYTRHAWQIDVAQAEWMADTDWGIGSFGETRLLAAATVIEVRTVEVLELAEDDVFEIGGETFVVQGEPVRDGERLVWTAELRQA